MANTITRVSSSAGRATVLASAERTAAPDTQELEVAGYRGLHLTIDVTAVTDTPSITVTILGVDRVSAKTYTILASAAITATGTTILKVGPGLTAAANAAANDVLPPVIRISVAHGDSDAITYSIGASLCV